MQHSRTAVEAADIKQERARVRPVALDCDEQAGLPDGMAAHWRRPQPVLEGSTEEDGVQGVTEAQLPFVESAKLRVQGTRGTGGAFIT